MSVKLILATFCAALVAAGCQPPTPRQAMWSGRLQRTDSKTIPFQAFVDLQTQPPTGYFLVGGERTPIPEITHTGDSLAFLFSEYNAAMRGILSGATWRGAYVRYRSTTMSIPFTAVAEITTNAPAPERTKPAIPLVGTFQAFIGQGVRTDSFSVGTFWMKNDSIFGTLIAPDGDYGLNAGIQRGTVATLNRFTGWQAQRFELTQDGDKWKGALYVRDDPATAVELTPRPSIPATIAGSRVTSVKNRQRSFFFSGVTAAGDTLSATSAQFKGKALIVDIMGTWCHNCMDESPILQQVYTEYKDKGLEVVALSFEINDDYAQARKNLRLYQQRYGITFPILFCGSTADKYVGPQLRSQLDDFYAYPTALFIDKAGRVRAIHIGFRGPGTGEEFQAEVSQIYREVKRITGP
jgi:thiol-disulfide isomerase/thioredoxin